MSGKDYYMLLGIPREESTRGIRKAFRDLARRHHPDRAGPSGTPMFRDVVEAYRVLSDPDRRRAYDAKLDRVVPIRTAGRSGAFARVDLFADAFTISPTPRAEHPGPLLCNVSLSALEARRGGVLPLRIPVQIVCPDCRGAGRVFGFACRQCDATGDARSDVTVPLSIPARIRSGSILELPLDRFGIRNLWLRVHVRVAA